MKKIIHIILAMMLLAGCASKKYAVRTEYGESVTSQLSQTQATDSTATEATTTQTVEMHTDSTTETLTFEMTDSGSVEIAADGSISAKGVKSLTKQKKRRQNERRAAKTDNLTRLDYHNGTAQQTESRLNHWHNTDSLSKEPITASTVTSSILDWLTNGVLVLAIIAVCYYVGRKLVRTFVRF